MRISEMEAAVVRRYSFLMRFFQRLLSACYLLSILASSSVAAADGGATPPLVQLGAGDEVKIDVFGNPDLATTTNVTDDGLIRMPLAGAVSVGGQSLAEAARRIELALKAGQFLVDPHVTVTVVKSLSQRVSVLGEVKTPGSYAINSNSTVLDLIALAGGLSDKASEVVYILRADESGKLRRLTVDIRQIGVSPDAGLSGTTALRGGDTVTVPKGTFFVTGQVVSPGEYRINGDMMLYQAIATAGGVTPLGSTSRVEVKRRGPDGRVLVIKHTKDLRVEPGDVINVKERLF